MPLEPSDKDLIVDRLAINPDFEPDELALLVRDKTGTPCTADEIEQFISEDETQKRIETKRSYHEKRSEYTKQELINEMISAKEEISDILEEMRNNNRAKSTVEAAGELRKTLELLGKTIDAIQDQQKQGDQYIRIDEFNVDMLAEALPEDDIKAIVEKKNGLIVKHKKKDDD